MINFLKYYTNFLNRSTFLEAGAALYFRSVLLQFIKWARVGRLQTL